MNPFSNMSDTELAKAEAELLRSLRRRGAAHFDNVSLKILGNVPHEGVYSYEATFNGRRYQSAESYGTIEEAQHEAIAAAIAGPKDAPVERAPAKVSPRRVSIAIRAAGHHGRHVSKLLREMDVPTVLGYELNRETLTPVRRALPTRVVGQDYGSDPLGNGMFKMMPSGDIVDFEERNRRLGR